MMDEENQLIALRRKKLDALRSKGVEPFGAGFEPSGSIAEVREKFKERWSIFFACSISGISSASRAHAF